MNKYIYILLLVILCSCDDYLDIKPKGELIPSKVEEFDLMLSGVELYNAPNTHYILNPWWKPWMYNNIGPRARKAYNFEDYYCSEIENDGDWESCYKSIFSCNTIIDGVDELEASDQKDAIIAEAKLQRAYYHFMLVNLYGKHYNKTTASQDLGVPIIQEINFDSKPTRATVQEVYDFVIADIKSSADHLVDLPQSLKRGSKSAAYALLARVYLYMGDFKLASDYADKALAISDELNDLNKSYYPLYLYQTKEYYMYKNPTAENGLFWNAHMTLLDKDVISLFEPGDLRINNSKFFPWSGGDKLYFELIQRFAGVGTPEMYFIKAEYFARVGRNQDALDIVNLIRKHRIPTATYEDIELSNITDMFDFVMKQKELDFLFKGLTYFDIKRLNAEGKWNRDIQHYEWVVEKGETIKKVKATLKANENKWVLAIPPNIIKEFNSGLEQNPR